MPGGRTPPKSISLEKQKVLFVADQLKQLPDHQSWADKFIVLAEKNHKGDAASIKFFDAMVNAELRKIEDPSIKAGLEDVMSASSLNSFYEKVQTYMSRNAMDIDSAANEEPPQVAPNQHAAAGRLSPPREAPGDFTPNTYGRTNELLRKNKPKEASPYAAMPVTPSDPDSSEYGNLNPSANPGSSSSGEHTSDSTPNSGYDEVPPQEAGIPGYGDIPTGTGVRNYDRVPPQASDTNEYGGVPTGEGVEQDGPTYERIPSPESGNDAQPDQDADEIQRRYAQVQIEIPRGKQPSEPAYGNIDPRYKKGGTGSTPENPASDSNEEDNDNDSTPSSSPRP